MNGDWEGGAPHKYQVDWMGSYGTIRSLSTFKKQVDWMGSHDIIVAAHGAGLTNAAFIQPGTIVMELFPPNYYVDGFFQPLIEQSGSS